MGPPAFLWLSFPHSTTQLDQCGTDLLPGVPSFSARAFLKGLANVWEAAVSPLGGLQSAAHRRCAKRARSQQQSPVRYVKINQQMANLKGQAPYAGLGSCSPLFFSPQEPGDDRSPPLNFRLLLLLGLLGRFFALLKRSSKFTSKKHRKKCENRGFWPPKTLPKSSQNASEIDVPKNIEIFIDFQSIFAACCKSRTMILCAWP